MAECIPPATRMLAAAAQQLVSSWRGAYANAPVTDINADKLREPTYIRLPNHRTLSLTLSLFLALAALAALALAAWRYPHCPVLVTLSILCLSHAHSLLVTAWSRSPLQRWRYRCTLHMMGDGNGRLLSRITAVDNMAAASIWSRHALFEYRDAVYVILATYIGARYNIYIYTRGGGGTPLHAALVNPPILVWNNSPCCLECGL